MQPSPTPKGDCRARTPAPEPSATTAPLGAKATLELAFEEALAALPASPGLTRPPVSPAGGIRPPTQPRELLPAEREWLCRLHYSLDEVRRKTEGIYRRVTESAEHLAVGNYDRIAGADLRRLFELYDERFFNGLLGAAVGGHLTFRISKRMTRSGGKTSFSKHGPDYEISISAPLMFATFGDVEREVRVNGIVCRNRLEATMRVFEHELIHLLEFALFETSSCARERFRTLSHNFFGHTAQTHRLVTQDERAWANQGLRVGSRVSFDHEGETRFGTIYRITKRATVMVLDPGGCYLDAQRNRYRKYYVPLDRLRPAG